MSRRGIVVGLFIVAVVVVIAVLGGRGDPAPYDLDSATPRGYKAYRVVLEELGVGVERPALDELGPSTTERYGVVVVVDGGGASEAEVERLRSFASAGGRVVAVGPIAGLGATAVVDDPGSTFESSGELAPEDCEIAGAEDVRGLLDPTFARLHIPDGGTGCFGDGDGVIVAAIDEGRGEIVTLASPELFTNDTMRPRDQEIDEDAPAPMPDNVVLAVGLSAPDGVGPVAVIDELTAAPLVTGERTLGDLLSPGVQLGLWQLVAAFAFYAWWRGRRHGRLVAEPLPVEIAGSELVSAVGNLMERQGDVVSTAAVLRHEVVRQLCERLGVPPTIPVESLAALVAQRSGRDPDLVLDALSSRPVASPADLVRLVDDLESIRPEVVHV
ncbi:MAG TPA: DUF4350 domain-containing protein [Microthrixaceae bacterium]|nr:DUF4350 domain-containing protein [Microthrixaceae bacterium]